MEIAESEESARGQMKNEQLWQSMFKQPKKLKHKEQKIKIASLEDVKNAFQEGDFSFPGFEEASTAIRLLATYENCHDLKTTLFIVELLIKCATKDKIWYNFLRCATDYITESNRLLCERTSKITKKQIIKKVDG